MVTFAIDPRKSAVVAVDLQNCNVEKSPIAAPLGLQVVDKLNLLAAHYRAAGSTIIWTRHVVRPDHSDVGILGKTVPPVAQGAIDDGAPSAALHPKVVDQAGDIILTEYRRRPGPLNSRLRLFSPLRRAARDRPKYGRGPGSRCRLRATPEAGD